MLTDLGDIKARRMDARAARVGVGLVRELGNLKPRVKFRLPWVAICYAPVYAASCPTVTVGDDQLCYVPAAPWAHLWAN